MCRAWAGCHFAGRVRARRKTAQASSRQVTSETTSQAISQKIELAAGSYHGAHPAYREEARRALLKFRPLTLTRRK